MTDGC